MGLVADYESDSSDDEDEEYPDAGGKVVLLADVDDAGEERGTKRGRATGEDEIEETMEFPQHKSSIVTASAADIARETGAELEYIEGKFDAMARVRGIVARLVIRGTDAQVAAARRETQARLDALAADAGLDAGTPRAFELEHTHGSSAGYWTRFVSMQLALGPLVGAAVGALGGWLVTLGALAMGLGVYARADFVLIGVAAALGLLAARGPAFFGELRARPGTTAAAALAPG